MTVRIFLQPIEQDQDQYLAEYLFLMAANSSNPERAEEHMVRRGLDPKTMVISQ